LAESKLIHEEESYPENGCDRYQVLDCLICKATKKSALEKLKERLGTGKGGFVCFSNVHTVVTALNDARLRNATNHSFMSLPDGKPIYWVGKYKGIEGIEQVAGPDFFGYCLEKAKGLKHFLYGSTEETLQRLVCELKKRYPDAELVGTYSPPFRALRENEKEEIIDLIKSSGADLVWVGLGAPKQEMWMNEMWHQLRPAVLLGVGAAFDFYAGTTKRAPEWMRCVGMEWLYRLIQEPRRLWKRYFVTNTLFIVHMIGSAIGLRKTDDVE